MAHDVIYYKELRGWPSIKIITVQREFCLRPFSSGTSRVTFLRPRAAPI